MILHNCAFISQVNVNFPSTIDPDTHLLEAESDTWVYPQYTSRNISFLHRSSQCEHQNPYLWWQLASGAEELLRSEMEAVGPIPRLRK